MNEIKAFPIEHRDDCCVVLLDGDIDIAVAAELVTALETALETQPSNVLVDLNRVTFMDSTALNALVRGHKRAHAVGGTFRLVGRNTRVEKLLRITQLDGVLPMYDTVECARAAQQPSGS